LLPVFALCLLALPGGAFGALFPASRLDEPDKVRTWREQLRRAVEQSRGNKTLLVVVKKARRLDYYRNGRLQRSMYADLGADPVTRKLHSDFRTTPEGLYRVARKLGPGETLYTLALLIDYPNAEDRQRYREAQARGEIPPETGIGGSIEIHGMGGVGQDWTWGCMAVSDEEIRWLYPRVEVGTPVLIVGNDGAPNPVR
jgi:murein L,D-transpeptidase YafK